MQLSPKSIFIGLVAFGLPIAVAVGWTLADPRQPSAASPGGGTGGIGAAAPEQGAGDGRPVTTVRYSTGPGRPQVSPSAATSAAVPLAPSLSVSPSSSRPPLVNAPIPVQSDSTLPLPPLNNPPVPTPTEIVEEPGPSTSSSGEPSGDPSAQP